MNISLLKQIIKEELENVLENESSDWDTLYNWLNIYTRNDDKAKSFLYKYNIINGTWLKKVLDSGEVTIDQINDLAKNPEGQSLSDLSMYKRLMGMNEESATGAIGVGAGPIMTPYAFAPKGQKTNKATQTAIKQGFKKASGMPKNSKMLDYKELWKGKKSAMNEVLTDIIKEELLNEVSYNKFKNEVKYRTKAEMLHKGIREVKRKLAEVDQLIEYTTRIKQELSENDEGSGYWKRSLKAINEISEISNKISNKIKSIYQ
jgi:hypothetical protein